MTVHKHHPRIALRIHRKNIWISELLTYLIVAAVGAIFTAALVVILRNEVTKTAHDKAIAGLRSSLVSRGNELRVAREKYEIAETVRSFVRDRLPPAALGELVDLVYDNSHRFGYDPLLVLAVIHVESVFEVNALGKYRSGNLSGALGLMQIKFETAREVARDLRIELDAPEQLLLPEINVPLGIGYLTRLIAQFRSFKLGVIAYNLGPGAVYQSLSSNTPLPMTYYARALRSYYRLKDIARERQRQT